ncbi:MAG: DMT family transporter [Methylibium sp.]|nr:DMT family transporter [Methylibium sp.]
MPHGGRAPWWAYACLAAAMVLVGSYVALSKLLVVVFPVFLLVWLRFGIATLAMAHWVRREPDEAALSRQDRRLLFTLSLFGNFLFSVCMLFGVSMSSALAAGVIMAALPAVVALMCWMAWRERLTRPVAAGIACAVAGIALVSLSRHGEAQPDALAPSAWLGHLLLLGAVCCEAIYVVIGKQLTSRLSARRISALINLWGLLLVTPIGFWQAWRFDFGAVAGGSWALLLFYSLAASMVSVWLWMRGLEYVPASSAGVYTVLLPVSAAAVGTLLLGERIDAMQAGAFALALAGVVLATWPGKAAVHQPPQSADRPT